MSYLIQSARTFVNGFLTDHIPSPLEMQMAKQLKEQSLQMEEMKQLMEGMKALIIKMEVETTRLRATRTAEAERRAAAKRKVEEEHKRRVEAEAKRKADSKRRADELRLTKSNPWTCPADGCVYPWTYKDVKYLRNSENQVWMYDGKECGDWKGLYIMAEDRIDETARDPYEDE